MKELKNLLWKSEGGANPSKDMAVLLRNVLETKRLVMLRNVEVIPNQIQIQPNFAQILSLPKYRAFLTEVVYK